MAYMVGEEPWASTAAAPVETSSSTPVVVVDEHGDCLRGVAAAMLRGDTTTTHTPTASATTATHEGVDHSTGRNPRGESETVLLHFDSHPDLDAPVMPRGVLRDVAVAHAAAAAGPYVDVATWILPLIAARVVGTVVWVKPTWSQQIACGTYPLLLSADTNRMRVGPRDGGAGENGSNSSNAATHPSKRRRVHAADAATRHSTRDPYAGCRDYWRLSGVWREGEGDAAASRGVNANPLGVATPFTLVVMEAVGGVVEVLGELGAGRVILDIDEDYFSCANPIRESLRLFASQEAVATLCGVFADNVTDSREFLAALERYIEQGIFRIKAQVVRQRVPTGATILRYLGAARETELRNHLLAHADDAVYPVTETARFADMHELPEHIATSREINAAMATVAEALRDVVAAVDDVAGVIVAQSVTDGYTPAPQAPFIHNAWLAKLREIVFAPPPAGARVHHLHLHHCHPTKTLFLRAFPPEAWLPRSLDAAPIYVTYQLAVGAEVSFPEARVVDAGPAGLVPAKTAGGRDAGDGASGDEEDEEEEEEEGEETEGTLGGAESVSVIPWEAVRTWSRAPAAAAAVDLQGYNPHASCPGYTA